MQCVFRRSLLGVQKLEVRRGISRTIFIKGLPDTVTKEQMMETFKEYGEIKSVRLFQFNERFKTAMGTVAFTKGEYAMAAIDELDDTMVLDRRIKVAFNQPLQVNLRSISYNGQGSRTSSAETPDANSGTDRHSSGKKHYPFEFRQHHRRRNSATRSSNDVDSNLVQP